MMTKQLPKELVHARDLIDQAKFKKALVVVENYENSKPLSPEDQLLVLLVKGKIYHYTVQHEERIKVSESAYLLSQDLGWVLESIEALIGKAYIAFRSDLDKASIYAKDAERRLKSLVDDSSTVILRRDLFRIKSWIQFFKNNFHKAARLAQKCLSLTEEKGFGNELDLAMAYSLLGYINVAQTNGIKALEYAMESLKRNKEFNRTVAIAIDYSLIAKIYLFEGDYEQALKYGKQSLSIQEITKRVKLDSLSTLGQIYYRKGNINRALKYQLQAVELSEELNITDMLILNLIYLGYSYRMVGRNDLAIKNTERSLIFSEKWGFTFYSAISLFILIMIHIDEDSRGIANRYLSRLSDLNSQKKNIMVSSCYLISKAYVMKTSTRMRDHVDAQGIFKELIDGTNLGRLFPDYFMFCIGNLCDLLLEELSMYNDPEIIDEILPLITKCLDIAEDEHNYYWLAEGKLLQGKLALIQMKFEEGKRLMVEAQRIAELHGLSLLAWGISSEHDKLLEQVDIWDKVKKDKVSFSERIKLASTNDVLERIQRRSAVDPIDSENEEPILLLIMDNSGTTYFNHLFVQNWEHGDLFSSFMSAFNTFSDEIFSRSIDRIRIGENTILINPVEPFLACYVIRGQSYPALQKLNRFSETIKENSEIWDALNKSIKTGEALEIDKPASLKTIINDIFTQ
jgi:tetratricopeptide (TPR) repeat protein